MLIRIMNLDISLNLTLHIPHLHKTAVISRFSNYNPDEYSVTDVESGDRIKFIAAIN
jgi:hypothetical protein